MKEPALVPEVVDPKDDPTGFAFTLEHAQAEERRLWPERKAKAFRRRWRVIDGQGGDPSDPAAE